jgi:hypothetical protein
VQDYVGHKDIRSTMEYARMLNPEEKAAGIVRDWK